ncbi:MAG: O-antigen ligase family protein [Campylobacterales bacterium]|nr:O-antigen ligase family protein [Campylobacterales bacterium]
MFALINILVFTFVTLYAFRLLFSKDSYVKLSATEEVLLNGREKFLIFTLATGMIAISTLGLSSIRLMIWLLMMIFAFIMMRKSPRFNLFTGVYLIFLLWLIIAIVLAPSLPYAIRMFLKYLYPFVALLFAATFVQSKDFIFVAIRWMLIAALIVSIFLGGFMTHIVGVWFFYLNGVFWPISTLADYLAVMSAVSLVMWWRTKEKKYLFLILWFILSATLQSVRTGVLSIGIMLIMWTYLRFKLASLPFILGGVLIGVSMILYVPSIKEKMFYVPEKVQSINDITESYEKNNLNTSMRATMWADLLKRFYVDNRWLGSGLGAVQHYMYTHYVFGGLKVPHNDFVQLACDTGKIGVWLYLLFPLMTYIFLMKHVHKLPRTQTQVSAVLAILSYAAILPSMNFDNVVNYAFAAHAYPFIFIGIFMASRFEENNKDSYA